MTLGQLQALAMACELLPNPGDHTLESLVKLMQHLLEGIAPYVFLSSAANLLLRPTDHSSVRLDNLDALGDVIFLNDGELHLPVNLEQCSDLSHSAFRHYAVVYPI